MDKVNKKHKKVLNKLAVEENDTEQYCEKSTQPMHYSNSENVLEFEEIMKENKQGVLGKKRNMGLKSQEKSFDIFSDIMKSQENKDIVKLEDIDNQVQAIKDISDQLNGIQTTINSFQTQISEFTVKIDERFTRVSLIDCLSHKLKVKNLTSIDCDVHPSHTHFKDTTSFSLNDLPECYRQPEMMELVKSVADLTVMLAVHGIVLDNSTKRDELVFGSGKVDEVIFHTGTDCQCSECNVSPKNEWAEIRIVTSSQFVYDKDDASKIESIFFYDDNHRLDEIKCLTGNKFAMVNTESNVCIFTCITCDKDLAVALDKMLDSLEKNWEKAFDKFATSVRWEEEKLVIIVSHPHGFKKQISVGKKVLRKEEKNRNEIIYDTPTCEGSTGAFVLVPDFDIVDDILYLCL